MLPTFLVRHIEALQIYNLNGWVGSNIPRRLESYCQNKDREGWNFGPATARP